VQCINCGDKEEENPEEMKTIMKLCCLLLQERVTFVNLKDTRQLTAPRKLNQEGEVAEVAAEAVAAVATRVAASLWDHATSVENLVLEARCKSKDWQFGIEFEYTARATPQHNHMAELGFATLGNKGRALMVKANIPEKYRYHLFREAFCTATDIDDLVVIEVNGKRETRFFTCLEKHLNGQVI
jgi:hypothetical protein